MVMDNFVCLQHRLREQLLLDLLLCALSIIGQILHQLNWTQDCSWMAVDELCLDELQLETAIKSILNGEEDVQLGSNNVEKFRTVLTKRSGRCSNQQGKRNITVSYHCDCNMVFGELLNFICCYFVVAVPIAGHGLCEGSLMTVTVRHV